MNKFLATFMRAYHSPETGGEGAAGGGALDIESRINAALSGNDGDDIEEEDGDLDDNDDIDPTKKTQPESDDVDVDSEDDDQTLASALGLDENALAYDNDGNVVFNAVIDGEAKQVTMQDLVKSYQLEGHVTKKSMKLESDRREFEAHRDQAYDHLAQRITAANGMVSALEKQLLSEFESIDWNTLRQTDPAEWAAYRQYYSERVATVENLKSQVAQSQGQLTEQQKTEAAQKQQQFLNGEVAKMIADNPTWNDQAVMAKEVGEIGQFLASKYGFSPEEMANAMDARLMRLIRDAHAFHTGKDTLKSKKVPDNLPKFRSSGQQTANRRDTTKARQVKANKDAVRKSGGSIDSIAQSIVDRM